MSKGSQQQPTTPRNRMPTPVPRPKQSGKGDANGAKASPHRDATTPLTASENSHDFFAIVPSESAEDDFFARGEANSSLAPAAMDVPTELELDDLPEARPLSPAQLERRARLRRLVATVVGAAAMLTAVVGAKALSAPAKVKAADGALNVPHQVVASIAMAPQDEPAAPKTQAPDNVAAAEPAAPAALETAPVGENPAAQEHAAEPSGQNAPNAEVAAAQPPPAARRLPVIDIEIPTTADPAIDRQWESAAKNLASQDFKGADSAFAELGKRSDPATREAARLARAAWWTANGRQNEVKPVIADLAANATTPSVRQKARDLLRTN